MTDRPRIASFPSALASPEIQHLDAAFGRDLDVRGLEVAVDDAFLVRVFQGFGDLARDGQRFFERNRPLRNPLGERRALDQFQHQRALLDAVDGRDIRMVERRQHLRLAREPRHAVGVLREGFGNDFDGDFAIQLGVGGAVNFPMPPSPSLAVMR